jgi:hypothetical protein
MNKKKAVSTIVADSESGGFTARQTNNFNESNELSHLNLAQIRRDLRHRKNRLSKQGYLD